MIARPIWCRRFIGREAELEVLGDARRAAARSRGGIVLIGGEAGIGKSRLVSKFLSEIQGGRASHVAVAECVPGGDQPLSPIRSLLRALVPDDFDAAPALAQRAFAQLVPDALPSAPRGAETGMTLGKTELFSGLAALLQYCTAKRAATAVIEDAHWADRSTLDFLAYLATHVAAMRLLVVTTYRPDEIESRDTLADTFSRILREHGVRHVLLEPLAEPDVMKLLDGALDTDLTVEADVLREIAGLSDGNPFFAEELLKDAIERPHGPRRGELPVSIRASIRHRLGSLSGEDRRTLEIAAVLGHRFDPLVLARVGDRPVADVAAALRRARDANIILEEASSDRCQFRHALTRQTIYDALVRLEAQALHRKIVAVIEALPDQQRDPYELAYHAWEAKDVEAAFAYNERAGEAAFALGALPEASASLERALSLARDDDERARIHETIGHVAAAQAEFERSISAFESALAIAVRSERYDDAARLIGFVQGERSNVGEAAVPRLLSFIEQYGVRLSVEPRDRLVVFTARLLSASYAFTEVRRLLDSVSPPDRLPPRVRANYFACVMNAHAADGDLHAWRDIAVQARAVVPELPPSFAAVTLAAIALSGVWLGDRDLVRCSLEEADAITARWGIDGVATFLRAVRAQHEYVLGDVAAARDAVERVLARPEVVVAQICVAAVAPLIARSIGDAGPATRCLAMEPVRAHLEGKGDSVYDTAMLLGAFMASEPRRDDGMAARLLDLVRRLPARAPRYPTLLPLLAERADRADLAAVLELADPAPLHRHDEPGRATAALARAIVRRRTGDPVQAAGDAREAAQAFAHLGWPLFEARAWEVAGERARAVELYRRCSAAGDLRRLEPPSLRASAVPAAVQRDVLSAREMEVARLVADGQTNAVIAERLNVGRKTIEKHVASILDKLQVRSRAQIATLVGAGRFSETG